MSNDLQHRIALLLAQESQMTEPIADDLKALKAAPIAVLFVQPDSHYKSLGVESYDAVRDARTYTGDTPVVAHPPCKLWGKMAKINHRRWGGEHNRPGNDGGCFRFALETVDRCGGVLEHPASTHAWLAHGLQRPPKSGWGRSGNGWVCEVWQSAYGHRANKKTWLYCAGTDSPIEPRRERIVGTHQVGFPDKRGKVRNKPTLSKREANATPPEFATFLINLAMTCGKYPAAKADAIEKAILDEARAQLAQHFNLKEKP